MYLSDSEHMSQWLLPCRTTSCVSTLRLQSITHSSNGNGNWKTSRSTRFLLRAKCSDRMYLYILYK